jgi:hypothetical protein
VTERDVRKDLSYFRTTQPSASTEHMLEKLETPVKAILFWRKTDDVLQEVEPYFASLAKRNAKFSYEVLDSAFAPELSRKNKIKGNGSVLLLQGEGDKQKGQAIQVGNELTEARTQLRKFDGVFQQNFTKLARPERAVSLTVGHAEHNSARGEEAEGDTVKVLDEVWRRLNIKTSKLGVSEGLASSVPEGTGAVIAIGPKQNLMP